MHAFALIMEKQLMKISGVAAFGSLYTLSCLHIFANSNKREEANWHASIHGYFHRLKINAAKIHRQILLHAWKVIHYYMPHGIRYHYDGMPREVLFLRKRKSKTQQIASRAIVRSWNENYKKKRGNKMQPQFIIT